MPAMLKLRPAAPARVLPLLLLLGGVACDPTTPDDTGEDSAADSAQDSAQDSGGETGQDTDTGGDTDTGQPAEACVPTSEAAVTLCADRFWSQTLDVTSQAEVDAAIAEMPLELREQGLADPVARAQQLQWAFVALDAISAPTVALLFPDGTYDFTGLDSPHAVVPDDDVYQLPLLPKLFVRRDGVILRAATEEAVPVLTASGPGADGVNHGRVFLLFDSGATDASVEGLAFRGDAESAHFTDPARSMHENDASLWAVGQWGMVMVGYNGGANEVSFDGCYFLAINGAGISAVGVINVSASVFQGVLPEPETADPEEATVALYDAITAARGVSPGMDFHSGIRRAYAYGPTEVKSSRFYNLVQGIVMAADGYRLGVMRSMFSSIYDHGVYVLGDANGSFIIGSQFERIGNGAVKFAGHSTEADPELSLAGLHDGAIADNRFTQMRNGAMNVSGVRNEIARNEVVAYDPSTDPTGYYDPFQRPDYHYPDAFLITEGGQAGWANHVWGNIFLDNTTTDGAFEIFVQQRPNVEDRSISENTVSGAGQTLYFRHLVSCVDHAAPCSNYVPTVTAEAGATLVFGAPADCADCYPGDTGYISELP